MSQVAEGEDLVAWGEGRADPELAAESVALGATIDCENSRADRSSTLPAPSSMRTGGYPPARLPDAMLIVVTMRMSVMRMSAGSERSRAHQGGAWSRVLAALVAVVGLVALVGCGSSKPAYCSDRTNLENSIKGLTSLNASSGVSGLESQVKKIESDATALVSSAEQRLPQPDQRHHVVSRRAQELRRGAVIESLRDGDRRGHQERGQRGELG